VAISAECGVYGPLADTDTGVLGCYCAFRNYTRVLELQVVVRGLWEKIIGQVVPLN